ncbi:MAG: Vms1/Ankzf1 family peptidyl-tRNA hydrolase, partial [Actinomycetota bacterium]
MAALEPDVLRRVAAWETDDAPVTSLYLDLDGRRRPRRAEYVRRADDLTRRACDQSEGAGREAFLSVRADRNRITSYVRDTVDRRGSVRGLAAFSSSAAGLWEAVTLPQPVRDGIRTGPRPHLLPLESLLELAETFCTAIVDREKARLLVSRLGTIEDVTGVLDDVPGRHDQGGWAQARHRRHIEDHVQRHLKHVADALLRLHERHRFAHLVVAGPEETVAELERGLHDYVRRTILGRTSLPITATAAAVLD